MIVENWGCIVAALKHLDVKGKRLLQYLAAEIWLATRYRTYTARTYWVRDKDITTAFTSARWTYWQARGHYKACYQSVYQQKMPQWSFRIL